MDQPPVAMCDIDGVVYPYVEALRGVLAERGVTVGEPTDYALSDAWNIPASVVDSAHLHVFASDDNHSQRPLCDGLRLVRSIAEVGYPVRFVTRRAHHTGCLAPDDGAQEAEIRTRRWLDMWMPAYDDVVFVPSKLDVISAADRQTVWIDDNPTEAAELAAAGQTVFLVDRSYTRDQLVDRRVRRYADDPSVVLDELDKAQSVLR